ncbi:response regulator [Alkalimarinus coralli]|uniref:response regulator n=1 Tax=Alkalimarinus coralli TaxID=2935863 RepID=UPI00202ACEEE|nr:response regulator [Alkalimarinus coralli]
MNQQARILVVDDAADNRLLLKMLLEDDYEVVEADSGEACLAQVNEQVPDLILLDITMPGLSGYEVCVQLRTQKETEHLPIIFISALVGVEQRLEGFEAGADDYLTKPVEAETLYKKITSCLQRQQSVKTAQTDASEAMRIAMEAMTTSSELGQIVQFVKNVQLITTPQAVGEAIQSIAKEFSLSTSVMVISEATHFIGCTPDSIEAKMLEQVSKSSERMVSIGIRTIIRNEHVTLLIKNMPLA